MPASLDEIGLTCQDLGLQSFDAPPVDFDPRSAPEEILKRFGVPARPTPETSIQYRHLWDRMFSDTVSFVSPRFKPRAVSRRVIRPALKIIPPVFNNWVGLAIESEREPIQAVYGMWTVPNLRAPPYVKDTVPCINSVWIGIDGFSPSENDILQAGVDLRVMRQGGRSIVEILPWWEWWRGESWYFNNFSVSPGDSIACCITCLRGGATGTVNMANLVTGDHIRLLAKAPSRTTLIGNCAEWIVERQTFNVDTDVLTELSHFGCVFLDQAFAATTISPPTNKETKPAGDGKQIMMTAIDKTTILADITILGPNAFRINRS